MEEENQVAEENIQIPNTEEITPATEEVKEISVEDLLKEEKEKFIRLYAEFENFKKRATKERIDLYKTAGNEIIKSLLPVLDDFERCTKEISKIEANDFTKGVELIQLKLVETLKNKGLVKQEDKMGDVFDVDKHEAITQIPAPSEELKNKIIDIVESGYLLGDKVIRYAKVVIGN